jgi:hypothetical protein
VRFDPADNPYQPKAAPVRTDQSKDWLGLLAGKKPGYVAARDVIALCKIYTLRVLPKTPLRGFHAEFGGSMPPLAMVGSNPT